MFVSSYSTYVNTSSSDRINRDRVEQQKYEQKSFSSELSKSSTPSSVTIKSFPVDYVINSKTFTNQYKLHEQLKTEDSEKLKKISDMKNAQTAYNDNSTTFSLLIKPKISLKSVEQIDKKLPENIQKIVEDNLKRIMANTYVENDKYYQVTA